MLIRNVRLKLGRILGATAFILALAAGLGAGLTYFVQERETRALRAKLQKAQSALKAAKDQNKVEGSQSEVILIPSVEIFPAKAPLKSASDRLELQRLQEFRRRLANGEPRAKILFEMAKLYHSLGAVEEAMRRFQACSEVDDPINEQPDFFHALGRAHHDLAQEDEAYESFTEAADLDPSQSAHLRARASLSLHIGELNKAVQDIEVAIKNDPKNPLNHQVYGQIAQAQLRFDVAEQSFKKSLTLLSSKPSQSSHSVRLDLAELYGIQGLHSKAMGQAHGVLSDDPKNARALFIHGRLSFDKEEYAFAKSKFQDALRIEEEWHERLSELEKSGLAQRIPRNAFKNTLLFEKRSQRARLLAYLALIEARQGDLEKSKQLAARALSFDAGQAIAFPLLKRSDTPSHEIHRVLLQDRGRFFHQPSAQHFYKRAEKSLRRASKNKSGPLVQQTLKALKVVLWQIPSHGLAKTKEAQCYAYLGEFARALEGVRISIFLTPNQADAFELQARLHSHHIQAFGNQTSPLTNQAKLALNALQSMAELCQGPWVKARSSYLAAQIHFDTQSYIEALEYLQLSRRTVPEGNTPKSIDHLASLFSLEVKIRKAQGKVRELQRSEALLLKLNLKRAKLRDRHYRIAKALFDQRKYNNAVDEFKLALAFNDHHAQIHYDLGVTYMKIGNFIPGVLSVMNAVERGPHLARKVAIKIGPHHGYIVDPKRVMEELDKLVKIYPKRASVLTLRAYYFCFYRTQFKPQKYSKDPVTKGVADCDQALKINPEFHFARLLRADLLSYGGHFERASLDYDRILKALPHWDTALSSQGIHFYRLAQQSKGKRAKEYRASALRNFRRCRELNFMDFQYRQDPIMKILRDDDEYQAFVKSSTR